MVISQSFVDNGNFCADFETMTRAIAYIDEEGAKYGYYMKRNKGTYLLGSCGSYERALQKK